ncbi:SGNH/GDSL hydrolase family protein [Streptomyces fildesensis]|uniref:SGNH/GDSL hydrolase family protein n=1 Tax=Streptomyces fildesensis TaxID=375757 RepID=A0ABW8C672_9ACTN
METATPAASATAVKAAPGGYVALGDSFSAGPGLPGLRLDSGPCARSDRNFPSLIAKRLSISSFTDVSCTAAVTDNMTGRQWWLIGPQFAALKPTTETVTVSIGGNDLGFVEVVAACAILGLTDTHGAPCKRHYTAGGQDEMDRRIAATAPKVGAVIDGIHSRSPRARVLLVGYQALLPASKQQCAVATPIADGDVPYLDNAERRANAMLADVAARHQALYVDTYTPSIGHDFCQTRAVRWTEGIQDFNHALPVHPNEVGMKHIADLVEAKLAD